MRRLITTVLLVVATATPATAQDRPPQAPSAGDSPDWDAASAAAFKRLAELCPTPGSTGVRRLRAGVTFLMRTLLVQGQVQWDAGGEPTVRLGLPVGDGIDDAEAARHELENRVGFVLTAASFWMPRERDPVVVRSARNGDGLLLKVSDGKTRRNLAEVSLDGQGLPTLVALSGAGRMRFEFVERGPLRAVSRVDIEEADGNASGSGATTYFSAPTAFSMPRTVQLVTSDGDRLEFAFHDVHLDDRRVAATSLGEAMTGRAAKRDGLAKRALADLDAGVARCIARNAECRLEVHAPGAEFVARATWTDEGICQLESAEPGAPPPDTRTAALRAGLALALADLMSPASEEFSTFDVERSERSDKDGTVRLDLVPVAPGTPMLRQRVTFDARGLPTEISAELRGGLSASSTRVYSDAAAGRVLLEDDTLVGATRISTKTTYYGAPGFPPLRHTMTKTTTVDGKSTDFAQTYTDWVVDGKPVPGTESKSVPEAPQPPK